MTRLVLPIAIAVAAGLAAACDGSSPSGAPQRRTIADSAEHVMHNGRMMIVWNGVRRGEAIGTRIFTLDAATRFHFRPLRVQLSTPLGRPLASIAAGMGNYSLTNPVLDASGPITITSDTARRSLTTKALRYDPATNQISSDSTFTATAGTRQLSGVGFTADAGLFTIKCLQRCSGSLGR